MKFSFVILILLSINAFESLTIKSETEPKPRVRKSINNLEPSERKALFWSIKALSILPPPKSFEHWNLTSLLNKNGDN